ncbi:SH3 domain-binding protein 1 isoform X2 [Dromaius novaehollandiae]|uniref:SH3 domain binding protein 1 n=1 Tax=Dromaius novaehollandiae TaxID=8790 RepID=A0A8C4K0J9_DRONO|nr:SH3 domain-binding protein 1 [Dromaius novaehollandiae]XP_025968353.1 SH3 domain-binding protein 1 [Dromaius novaehollandiae]
MMKRQFHRMRQQLSHPSLTIRAQESTELLTEDLLQIEQRIEPAKRAAHSVSKRLQACLQGQCGSEMDKRVKKLPLMALSTTMAESFKELDTESSLGRALEMGCCIQSTLAKILAEFEIALERDVLQPLNKLSEEELPIILKRKKTLQKLISDWNAIKSRLNQAAKSSSNSTSTGTGPGASSAANKLENLKEEEEEVKRKVEQCKDEYMADLYHFSTKEDSYASYFIRLMEIQAQYHRQSLGSLDSALAELKEAHNQTEPSFTADTPVTGYYGVSLETHLKSLGREIALPIEACVMMLLASGMREEGLFRLAAGASVLRKLKSSLASGSNTLEEFYADPHAVAGALKSYLRELPQPLMTFELYDEWVKVASFKDFDGRVQSLRDTCSRLPQENYNNLRYLIKFLAKLAEHQEVNKMTPSNIAIVLGPNLLWAQQSTGDPMQLDLASVSSIQVVGIVEALIQNADTLFPGEIDFNVSGMFTPPANAVLSEASAVEESSPKSPPASTPALPAEEVTRDSKMNSQPASPKVTRPSEAAGLLAPTPADDTTRKGKRPAPARPTVPPPPVAQPRSSAPTSAAPEHTTGPKALPRRMAGGPSRAPSVPPPLPPQPTRRQSRNGPQAPMPPTSEAGATPDMETTTDCDLGAANRQSLSPGGRSPPVASQPAGQASEND